MLLRAAEAGISFFDTADHYSLGRSESLIGKVFRGRRHAVVLSTKVGTTYSPVTTTSAACATLIATLEPGSAPTQTFAAPNACRATRL